MAGPLDLDGLIDKGLIGEGSFGYVYLVENNAHEEFAVKVMLLAPFSQDKAVAENELKVLKELSHDHVLVYVDSFVSTERVCIVTEYCSGGDLSGFLKHIGRPVPEDLLLVWLWQMACGLEYMHTCIPCPVLHRDLKPSNVYLTDTGDIRLGDMGIARILDAPSAMAETFCGSPLYMSPEALQEKPYNAKTDIWSLGCCVMEMATLERAFSGSNLYILRNAVLKQRTPLPREYGRELDDIVSKMLEIKAEDRWSATDILDTPLLQSYEEKRPLDFLERHKLIGFLATHRRSSPTSADVSKSPASTINTLTESMSDLKVVLNEGETITSYRLKVEKRMRGRREDSTLASSTDSSLATVLVHSQTVKRKTVKKTPKVPTGYKPTADAQPRDNSLLKSVLSSFRSTLSTMASQTKGMDTQTSSVAGDSTDSAQVPSLRRILTQIIGQDSQSEASNLVMSASSTDELLAGLAPLLGEHADSLSNIVIYLSLFHAWQSSSSM